MRTIVRAACAGLLGLALVACGGGAGADVSDEPAVAEGEAEEKAGSVEATEEADAQATEDEKDTEENTSKMLALYKSLSAKDGVHFSYSTHTDYLADMTVTSEVHIKDKTAYKRELKQVSGVGESTDSTAIYDGNVLQLDEEAHTGTIVTTVGSLASNVLNWDGLYQVMFVHSKQKDCTVEERELEGATYTVEVYPQPNDYVGAAAFYFDADGNLAYVLVSDLESGDGVGEQLFTVSAIDNNVDESLLDLSGYELTELEW